VLRVAMRSGAVSTSVPSRSNTMVGAVMMRGSVEHFQISEKLAPDVIGGGNRLSVRKCDPCQKEHLWQKGKPPMALCGLCDHG
jgi:hypothetical protein